MKNYVVLLIGLFLVSCSNERLDLQEQSAYLDNINLTKIEAMKTMDEASQKVAFNLLNSYEKHYFRIELINKFVLSTDLNENQLKIIAELKDKFTVDVYEENDYAEYFKNIFITSWLEKADRFFTTPHLYYLTTAHYENYESYQARTSASGCSCHLNSIIYCTKKRITVAQLSPDPSISVTTESVPCDSNICEQQQDENGDYEMMGCGFLWLHACNGSC